MAKTKQSKPKSTKFGIIDDKHYSHEMLMELIGKHHDHLAEAKIALVWRYDWKPDDDGRIQLGQASKVSDSDKLLHGYDFKILLNFEVCTASDWSDEKMKALLDHELTHCEVKRGEDEQIVRDEHGFPVYRIRKHDVEEFSCIAERHGLWKSDLEKFGEVIAKRNKEPLLQVVGGGEENEIKQAC